MPEESDVDDEESADDFDGPVVTKKFTCKFAGCGKSFPTDSKLAKHERIHLGIKPYYCTWEECTYASAARGNVWLHVRTKHFRLPTTLAEQEERGIVDDRSPSMYVRVDKELQKRRL